MQMTDDDADDEAVTQTTGGNADDGNTAADINAAAQMMR